MKDRLGQSLEMFYILDKDRNVVATNDMHKWGKWFQDIKNKRVASTFLNKSVPSNADEVRISTVFLGLDHGFGMSSTPVVFETMVFGGEHDQYQKRYCTWAEATTGHKRIVTRLQDGLAPDE